MSLVWRQWDVSCAKVTRKSERQDIYMSKCKEMLDFIPVGYVEGTAHHIKISCQKKNCGCRAEKPKPPFSPPCSTVESPGVVNLDIQNFGLQNRPLSYHSCDLLWLLLTNQDEATWLAKLLTHFSVTWQPTVRSVKLRVLTHNGMRKVSTDPSIAFFSL
jgi:hypothetical protein